MSIKRRLERLEEQAGTDDHCGPVVIRWPEDPDYRPLPPTKAARLTGEPILMTWPDGSEVTLP